MYPLGFEGWTMKHKMLWILQEANSTGQEWVHLNTLIREVGYTFRNRVSELRLDGFDIEHDLHKLYGHRYRLHEEAQGRLAI